MRRELQGDMPIIIVPDDKLWSAGLKATLLMPPSLAFNLRSSNIKLRTGILSRKGALHGDVVSEETSRVDLRGELNGSQTSPFNRRAGTGHHRTMH